MTPDARASEYVTYEWSFALGAGVRVIPILLKHTELHPKLNSLHYRDFTNSRALPWSDLIRDLQNAKKILASNAVHIPEDSPPYVKNIAAKISSHKYTEREDAIYTLGENDDPKAFEILLNALKSPMRDVRACAAMALGIRKDNAAVPTLIEALNDENEEVSENAAWALREIGTPEAKNAVDKWNEL
jgi:HEAT repeat protein